MSILRRIAAAFSLYSRIPIPRALTGDGDIENVVVFLPIIGVVIAMIMYGLHYIMSLTECPDIAVICAIILVPLVITGGFHIDGFMDTVDALRSYRSREKKLEILSDPHIGAFSVIGLAILGLFAVCSLSILFEMENTHGIPVLRSVCAVFVISRIFAVYVSIRMEKAVSDDMLVAEARHAKPSTYITLAVALAAVTAYIAYSEGWAALVLLAAFTVFTVIFRHIMMKSFGGITGDMAGYFVSCGEVFALCALAIYALCMSDGWTV